MLSVKGCASKSICYGSQILQSYLRVEGHFTTRIIEDLFWVVLQLMGILPLTLLRIYFGLCYSRGAFCH